jgi:ABC-type lipoprotein release transport system permease subunit
MSLMRPLDLIRRGLSYYWRTHLAVVLGVATAVAVLAGALLVGASVRGSLRGLVLDRLGRTDDVVASATFFTERLAERIAADPAFEAGHEALTPLVMARAMVTAQESGRRVGNVAVYGVDDRFWRFHGLARQGPEGRTAFVSPALARDLHLDRASAADDPAAGTDASGRAAPATDGASAAGTTLLVRVQRPTDVPLESLHGRKDQISRSLRVTVADVLPREALGEFSLEPTQADVRAVFVPLADLQRELEIEGRVNTLLASRREEAPNGSASLGSLLPRHATLEDLGLTITPVEPAHTLVVGSQAGLLDDRQADAARGALTAAGLQPSAVFTYLANSLRIGDREVPYSLVSALDLRQIAPDVSTGEDAIVLNQWAADDLGARAGDTLAMEYYVWEEPGQLVTRSATFTVAGIVPIASGGRDLAPAYPGISDSATLDDWDPPFPIDLGRVRPEDEAYWKAYRTTPKAFIPIGTGQQLWRSRYGAITSLRVRPPAEEPLADAEARVARLLTAAVDPATAGLTARDVRTAGLEASRGATDFGEYFVYFSFFLVVSALLLASLFFKLGVEQRVREIGLLRAVGVGQRQVRRFFLAEGLLLAAAGSLIGTAGAVGYAWLLMYALRTWWVGAVGTTSLVLHVSPAALLTGALGGLAAALVCIWWTLRGLARVSERSLLAGEVADGTAITASAPSRRLRGTVLLLAAGGITLLVAGSLGLVAQAGAFFGAGSALMAAALAGALLLLRTQPQSSIGPAGRTALWRLGMRYAGARPARSVLSMAVVASATFILIAVDAFRRDGSAAHAARDSGVGGYTLIVDTLLPVVHDPNTAEGRDALNLYDLPEGARLEPFRVRPGDDASCLNLYEPRNPRIMAPRDEFLREGRFAFAESLAETDAERANPWLLLQRELPEGVVPVIADANSMAYVLHRALGEEIVIDQGGTPIRLRLVAALRDSIFQGELVMGQANFVRLFPHQEGYGRLLVEAPAEAAGPLTESLEGALANFGADVTTTWGLLEEFHRVENTYLSTFQTLGGLGLLLGTVGLAAVLLRNVLERRRELALLGAVGYRRRHLTTIVLAENILLLVAGLGIGALAAGLAIVPAVAERGGRVPWSAGGGLLIFVVLAAGLLSSVVAIRAATGGPLLASLRSES